ncbi:hypothetical protein ACFL27_16130 [candidate division CSSED10-310 bacterium]|uniref:Capsular polysaccharide assembling protein CapF C-terminal domain-containing protein n=1 Tax=candidate division CSSED10-310 bacterium TaxID=2855610 RepID=A0ABV6YZV1_UNCC1
MSGFNKNESVERAIQVLDLTDETFTDQRGWVLNPLKSASLAGVTPQNFHLASLSPGSSRGNHAHLNATEWLLIFNGGVLFSWTAMDNKGVGSEITSLQIEHPTFLSIAPGTAHRVQNISKDTVYLIAFNDVSAVETVRFPVSIPGEHTLS